MILWRPKCTLWLLWKPVTKASYFIRFVFYFILQMDSFWLFQFMRFFGSFCASFVSPLRCRRLAFRSWFSSVTFFTHLAHRRWIVLSLGIHSLQSDMRNYNFLSRTFVDWGFSHDTTKIQTTKLLILLRFTFMMYKSSWKLVFIQIFALNWFLVLWWTALELLSFCLTWHLHDGRKSCHIG